MSRFRAGKNSHLPMEAHNQETYAIAVKSHGEEIYEHVQTQINHVFKTTRRELPPTSMAIEMGNLMESVTAMFGFPPNEKRCD